VGGWVGKGGGAGSLMHHTASSGGAGRTMGCCTMPPTLQLNVPKLAEGAVLSECDILVSTVLRGT
jgi:hypothetical protein